MYTISGCLKVNKEDIGLLHWNKGKAHDDDDDDDAICSLLDFGGGYLISKLLSPTDHHTE
jgi:hypothetical protein